MTAQASVADALIGALVEAGIENVFGLPGGEVVEVKLVDRLRAIDLAGRHMTVNAFGGREKAEAAVSFADLLRALSGAVSRGRTIDAELVQKLGGEGHPKG